MLAHTGFLEDKATQRMRDEDDRHVAETTIVVFKAKQQVVGKVIDGQRYLLFPCKMGMVAEGQNPRIFELRLPWKPISGPEVVQVSVLAPCFQACPSQSVNEDNIHRGLA